LIIEDTLLQAICSADILQIFYISNCGTHVCKRVLNTAFSNNGLFPTTDCHWSHLPVKSGLTVIA